MVFSDKNLVCKDCGEEFVFTAGEQEFSLKRVLKTLLPAVRNAARHAARIITSVLVVPGKGKCMKWFVMSAVL